MPYLVFSLIYLATTVAYLFFRTAQYKANVPIDDSKTDALAMYALFLKADLPFFLSRLAILIFVAIAISIYRRTVTDVAYSLIMAVELLLLGDFLAIKIYQVLS